MRRLIIGVVLVTAMGLAIRRMAPAMRSRFAEACERMLSSMPESFPPNRMMADLETLKERTARIVDLVDRPASDQSESPSLVRQTPISGSAHSGR